MNLVTHKKLVILTVISCIWALLPLLLHASNAITIQGVIIDASHKPLVGTNIILNQGEYGTITDSKGRFKFDNIPDEHYELTASAVGYTKSRTLISRDSINMPITITLYADIQELEKVEIINNAQKKAQRNESVSVLLVQEEFMKEAQAATLMQTLKRIPGINAMDAGTGISKPMIRGMSYYRVAVAQNGIKLEGQQWSNHHGTTIDQQATNHVEIIKGPASLQYGSGAIGGIINILPDHVPLTSGVSCETNFSVKSNTNWLGGSGNVSFRKRDLYGHINITCNSYGDFHIPETDSYLLPTPVSASEASHTVPLGNRIHNTAGKEQALSATTGIVKNWGNSYLVFNYYTAKTGFFDWQGLRNDSLHALHATNSRDIELPWQQVTSYSLRHITNRYFDINKLEISLGYQHHITEEYGYLTDRTGNRNIELQRYRMLNNRDLLLTLQTATANMVYTINSLTNQSVKVGTNIQLQHHTTDGYNHILPEYNQASGGIFIIHRYTLSDKWILNSGARMDIHSVNLHKSLNPDPEYGDSVFNTAFQKNYVCTSYSLGINYLFNSNTLYKLNIGKSYRVPSVYELGAYGLHRHEGRFEKGDLNNNPEEAWQLDMAFDKHWNKLSVTVSPFLNYFTNYLFLSSTAGLRPEGQVYEYQQTKAIISGGETSIEYQISDQISTKSCAEYVYAADVELNSALPFTPPLNILSELSYTLKPVKIFTKRKISLEWMHTATQNYTVPNELNTPGSDCFNLMATANIYLKKQPIEFMLKVRNLLNTKYYNHISFYRRLRIPEPGRDFQLFITIPIN